MLLGDVGDFPQGRDAAAAHRHGEGLHGLATHEQHRGTFYDPPAGFGQLHSMAIACMAQVNPVAPIAACNADVNILRIALKPGKGLQRAQGLAPGLVAHCNFHLCEETCCHAVTKLACTHAAHFAGVAVAGVGVAVLVVQEVEAFAHKLDQQISLGRLLLGFFLAGFSVRSGCLFQHVLQRLDTAARVQPVRHISLFRQAGQFNHTNIGCDAAQCLDGLPCVLTACIIVVGQDDHMAAAQELGMLLAPLASATCIAGCHQAQRCQAIRVFFALHQVHQRIGRCHQLGQPVGHHAHVLYAPAPAFAIGATLTECLGLHANDLHQQFALFIAVVVGAYDLGRGFAGLGRRRTLGWRRA